MVDKEKSSTCFLFAKKEMEFITFSDARTSDIDKIKFVFIKNSIN